ncbi:MAG: hypothetical protein NZ700_13405 [Gemmataceae bacterium]|nr:hypothetical protein [Gemmataceae bacterium]MDW8266414.1 hypothetical protein [Gemmataceae bacterium]
MSASVEYGLAELEAQAWRLLEHPKEIEPRDPIRRFGSVLRLWQYPAHGPQRSWTILTPGKKTPPGAGPLVREVVWDRDQDLERLPRFPAGGPCRPTIRVRDATLPDEELRQFLDRGAELAIPVVGCAERAGLDGEFFGLETYDVSPHVRLQWWCEGPRAWRHFVDWVTSLRAFVQQQLDGAG